jgi:Spy/CpxP family protein refolding chaperone
MMPNRFGKSKTLPKPPLLDHLSMMMKICFSIFIAFWLLVGPSSPVNAQSQRWESMRVAFITQDLGITAAQGEKFWPVFNEYSSKRKTMHQRVKKAADKALSDVASDAEVNAAIEDLMATRRAELDLFAEYMPKFRAIITPHQLGKLVTIEKRLAREAFKMRNANPSAAPRPAEAPE